MEPEDQNKSLFQNWISVIGSIISIVLFATSLFLFILDFLDKQKNPYLGVITYMILPAFLIVGLVMIPFGAWRERSKRQKRGYVRRFPQIDFNNTKHQKWALTSIGVITIFSLFSVFGAYRAYEFTESVTFCGKLCHQVMNPEFTAYHYSPHARVSCAQCHIGHGADWFVRSKLSGTYQIYSVIAKKYSKPIETPIKNLRPAQETCEQCHWPQKFFGAVEQDHTYFLSDEANTEWRTRMLMFVGGGAVPLGKHAGIHWHMNIKDKVYYVASDPKRQEIPWVKVVSPDGKEDIFIDKESKFSATEPPAGELRRMDCIDCHNRPSHIYRPPSKALDEVLASGQIDRSIPYIKREAVKALIKDHASTDEAKKSIRKDIENFYEKKYPDVWNEKRDQLNSAIQSIIQVYERNFFPEMKVSWEKYPDNIGHMIFSGCFRCHDGKHENSQGKVLSKDCKICHNIIEQGKPGELESNVDGLEFKHPNGDDEGWKEASCTDCHTGGLDS